MFYFGDFVVQLVVLHLEQLEEVVGGSFDFGHLAALQGVGRKADVGFRAAVVDGLEADYSSLALVDNHPDNLAFLVVP